MGNYDNKTEQELKNLLENRDNEIKRLSKRKLGLYWDDEREPEQVVVDCEKNIPVLQRVNEKEIKSETGEENILIEGDNFHALTCLNYTHRGKIDVIYIDPPYNTGAKDWKYNNKFVDKEDGYRHSKWLNFMEKRLQLAKNLLSLQGVFICAIDENELCNLGCLLENIFSNQNYEIHLISIIHNPRGVQGKNFSYVNEYAFFVIPRGEKIIKDIKIREKNIEYSNLRNWGGESLRGDAKNCFYSIDIDKKTQKIIAFGDVCKDDYHPKQNEITESLIKIYPVDKENIERKWRYARQSIEKVKNLLKVVKNGNGNYDIQIGKNFKKVRTIWDDKKYDANENGSKILKQILGEKLFNYPKSLYSVLDMLKISSQKNSTILDFFAGSGTTGHAVLELNKEDEGSRKFILCTNNEINGYEKELKEKHSLSNKEFEQERKEKSKRYCEWEEKYGICSTITYPRLEKIIKGYHKNGNGEFIEGLGGHLHYFKTDFVENINDQDQVRYNLTQKCGAILCVKENIFDSYQTSKTEPDYDVFYSKTQKKYLCIYYNLKNNSFNDFIRELENLKGKKIIYIFEENDLVNDNLFKGVKDKTVKPIPQEIMEIYNQIVGKK